MRQQDADRIQSLHHIPFRVTLSNSVLVSAIVPRQKRIPFSHDFRCADQRWQQSLTPGGKRTSQLNGLIDGKARANFNLNSQHAVHLNTPHAQLYQHFAALLNDCA